MAPKCLVSSALPDGGTRDSTMPSAAPRSLAYSSSSHTAASAYRLAVVMNSHRSEASRNWWANSRCACTTESMSGVSSSATPLGMPSFAASTSSPSRPDRASPSWRTRGTVGRNTFSANQSTSSGWQASTGLLVVGRRMPVLLTWTPTMLLTSVDLPAPVDPTRATSSGAPDCRTRGSR